MKYLKTSLNMILILIFGALTGIVLLCLVFLLPTLPMYQHVKDSAYVFSIEGEYPSLDGSSSKLLDNYTDALMLGSAIFDKKDSSLLEKTMNVYHPQYDDSFPTYCLLAYTEDYDGMYAGSNSRYWHGYLVFLKPLLLVIDYLQFRTVNRLFLPCLVLVILAVLVKRDQKKMILPFLAAVFFLRPSAVAFSLQYSTIFYISMISILIIALWRDQLKKNNRFLFYFLILGILTNYLDFLTYPIATLGISAVMWLTCHTDASLAEKIRGILANSVSWAFGYFGMWIAKWTAASLLLDQNVFQDALQQALFRTSDSAFGSHFTRWDAIYKNISMGFGRIEWLTVILFGAALLYGIWACHFRLKQFLFHGIPYLLVCLMPFVWYGVLQNHSYIHPLFTYRSLVVFVFAFLSMGLTARADQA